MYNFKSTTYTKLICFFAMLYIFSPALSAQDSSQTEIQTPEIRVALGLNLSDISITLPKGGTIFNPLKNKQIAEFSQKKTLTFRYQKNTFSIAGFDQLYSDIKITPSGNSFFSYKGKRYRGNVKIMASQKGISVINYVDLEKYLYGVVPYEVPMSWQIESIKAQAVAARTYAIKCLGQYPDSNFDVYDTVKDQVYGGVDGEHPKAIESVEYTRGLILTYQGWPIKAYYHSDAGGMTEIGKYVFPEDLPYLQSVQSKDDLPEHKWHFKIKKSEIEKLVEKSVGEIGSLQDIRVTSVSPTGRPMAIEITGDKQSKTFSSNDFRKMIGAGNIRSTLFTIVGNKEVASVEQAGMSIRTVSPEKNSKLNIISGSGIKSLPEGNFKTVSSGIIAETAPSNLKIITLSRSDVFLPKTDIKPADDEYLFVGSGFGHGVGMSQWGAKAYADDGWDYKKILLHYYRDTELSMWY